MPRLSVGPGIAVASSGVVIGLVMGLALGVSATPNSHPLEWDGHRWSEEFGPKEKEAFLGGFLAGAAASQAYAAVRGDSIFDPEALAQGVATLRARRELNYPYALNLFYARLHDYYFYIDRRDRPLYRALSELNFQLQKHHR